MKKGSIRVTIPYDSLRTAAQQKLLKIVDDRQANLETKKIFVEMCNKYVPYADGTLQESGHPTETGVIWNAPYAHYQYVGMVYGPNYPIYDRDEVEELRRQGIKPVSYNIANGKLWPVFSPLYISPIGFRTPKGMKKYPTGKAISYHRDGNPLASKEWDKKMLQNDRRVFNYRVTVALKKLAGGK